MPSSVMRRLGSRHTTIRRAGRHLLHIAVDSRGNVYVAENREKRIQTFRVIRQ